MTRWWRWTVALLLCGAATLLGPVPTAAAAPANAGVGHVVADLGTVTQDGEPGFSFDGDYYGYLVRAGDGCDVHVYDLRARKAVALAHAHVVCKGTLEHWAADTDSLEWQADATAGDITAYQWDASPDQVSVLAPDAHVFTVSGVSADGRYLAFIGRSDTHPAPSVDDPQAAGYVYDRTTGISLPLSQPDLHVQFASWSPKGDNFIANTGGHGPGDFMFGGCFGTRTSCRAFPDLYIESQAIWSGDGTAVLGAPASSAGTSLYDFTTDSLTKLNDKFGYIDYVRFVGTDSERLILNVENATVWDRKTGKLTSIFPHGPSYPSPTGRTLLFHGSVAETWRYLDPANPHEAAATFRSRDGYWTQDGSSFLGIGPGALTFRDGCSSLRQWSPATNTVSLFGPPGVGTCYYPPNQFDTGPLSSASGHFALFDKLKASTDDLRSYVVDLRRHVLLGPLQGNALGFAPAGSDLLAVSQPYGSLSSRLLLVDPTSVPDVDDKPRWSAATPATGSQVEVAPGGQVQVTLGASDLQQAPVNLYFRWRTTAGDPVAPAAPGWSCDRRRLAAGATEADCTFAPKAPGNARFLDVSATNVATGAQSDTRSYLVRPTPAAAARRH